MSNEFDPGIDAPLGQPEQTEPDQQPEPTYEQPQERMYSQREFDSNMGRARKSFEYEAQRRQEAAIAEAQASWQQEFNDWYAQQNAQQAQPVDPSSPFNRFDPTVAAELQAGLAQAIAPYQQRQADLAFQNQEAQVSARYPDYAANRAAILNFAVANKIENLDIAYRAFKYADRATIERQAVSAHLKRKAVQSAQTPSVEGRGGGAPSGRQNFKSREEMDIAAEEILRRANENSA